MAYYDPYYPRYKEDCYWYGEWQDMGARIPYCKCKKEHAEIGPKDCENCAEYHNKNKRTNADRIRAMSDEELAEYLANIAYDLFAMFVADPQKTWLDWLRQEKEC